MLQFFTTKIQRVLKLANLVPARWYHLRICQVFLWMFCENSFLAIWFHNIVTFQWHKDAIPDLSVCDYFLWGYLKNKDLICQSHSTAEFKDTNHQCFFVEKKVDGTYCWNVEGRGLWIKKIRMFKLLAEFRN